MPLAAAMMYSIAVAGMIGPENWRRTNRAGKRNSRIAGTPGASATGAERFFQSGDWPLW
jgi:hypothetical protein